MVNLVEQAKHTITWLVTLDNRQSMDKHVNEVSRTYFYHLHALQHIRSAITVSDANMIACSVVGSRLDYATTVLCGTSSKNINRLQRIQNVLPRFVSDSKAHRSSNALLHQLHWLPIRYRINVKLTKFAFLARSSSTSSYLNSSVARCLPSRTLRSQDTTFSPFLGHRQSSVRARSVLLRRPFLILSLRTSDQPKTSLYFAAF